MQYNPLFFFLSLLSTFVISTINLKKISDVLFLDTFQISNYLHKKTKILKYLNIWIKP